jgi:predicted acetyltransferase
MDALTLCRKMADINGWSGVDTIKNVEALAAVVDGKGGVIGKALLFDLMFKHEIDLSFSDGLVLVKRKNVGWGVTAMKVSKADAPRAILECIIKANEL